MAYVTRISFAFLAVWVSCVLCVRATEIRLQQLNMESPLSGGARVEVLLPEEISGVTAEHVSVAGPRSHVETLSGESDSVFLFVKGRGRLHAGETIQAIESETIALPISYSSLKVEVADGDTLHYLRINKLLSPEDLVEAPEMSARKQSEIYFMRFNDCQAYTEKIKSPKTVSRTVLPQGYAPRLAMGTVETTGPDAVGAHEHPMLDQLFLGLAGNDSIVYADDAQTRFPAFTLLHIPLASRHWVEVEEGRRMYYMWMDFFLTKEGLEWLKTHKHVEPSQDTGAQESPYGGRREYTVRRLPEFEPDLSTVALPDLAIYTKDSIRELVPAERNGTATIGLASEMELLEESFRRERGRDLQRRQGVDQPKVIYISDGPMTLEQVADQIDDSEFLENRDGIVTARLPLVIKPGGALILNGESTARLQLSTDRGAFVANAGRLFALDAVITSWSEDEARPTAFISKERFRPFISSYIRSETYLAGCAIEHLGYAAPTAYGFSLSSHPERERGEPREDWPTGVLVDNEFRGMYYGFYSYEARDVAIVGNRYLDSVVYGIDPHDRSSRLVIARNHCSGTVERHGIIGSRGITESFIFENKSHDNAGSGIMLDRQCTENVVCNNRVFRNKQGVAIYESDDNLISDNLIVFNEKTGIRVRNSVGVRVLNNTVAGHRDYAIDFSSKKLQDHDKRFRRGDVYFTKAGASFHGNAVRGNKGLIEAKQFDWLRMSSFRRDVDLSALAAEIGVDVDVAPSGDDMAFGQALKPLTLELERVFKDGTIVLEVAASVP